MDVLRVAFAMITIRPDLWRHRRACEVQHWMIFGAVGYLRLRSYGHMVWNGGLLSADGAISRPSARPTISQVVPWCINAAVAALIIVLIIGKRKGFGTQPFRPHNVPFVMLGAFLLWFGWFAGFNAGSAFAANGTAGYAWVSLRRYRRRNAFVGFTEKIRSGHYTPQWAPLRYGRRLWSPSPRPPMWFPRCGPS